MLAHDVRSAVALVLGASEMLEQAVLPAAEKMQVKQIRAAAQHINDLLEEALAVSQPVSVTELAPVLEQVELMWHGAAAQKGVAFTLLKKGNIPVSLRLPRLNLLRILDNIIGNAFKFSKAGSVELSLERGAGGALMIDVLDDGPGFSEAALAAVFSLRGRPQENMEEGTGYGLYIAHQLVEQAGGGIRVENRPEGGARVSILFPEDLLMDGASPPVARRQNGLPDLSHLRILLAEDNPTNQLVATRMLDKMQAQVVVAADGVEAMALLEVETFDLGLIDIEMPRKSGLEVLREVRAGAGGQPEMKLLALTAYVLPEHRERILAAGADGIISKPLTDMADFGNAILIHTGGPVAKAQSPASPDADIQMDIYDGLKEIIGHDSMQELLGKVLGDLFDVREGIKAGAAAKNAEPIRAKTHILISVAGAIGAVDLQHIAERLNATAKSGDWARILPEAVRCEAGISAIILFVEQELKS
ncbi:MAG: response regulator [Rhodobacteraceae bacterium]|nr:response regulator [Paracoccaceae bacterium]